MMTLLSPSKVRLVIMMMFSLIMTACSVTKFNTTGLEYKQSFCQSSGEDLSAWVVWWPKWRADQKDVQLRELAAEQAIKRFFSDSLCYTNAIVMRENTATDVSVTESILRNARAHSSKPGRLIMITIRELGPVLQLHVAPVFISGGTEVVIDINILNITTGQSIAKFNAHWQNGGAFVIKGTTTLVEDLYSALESALRPSFSKSQ